MYQRHIYKISSENEAHLKIVPLSNLWTAYAARFDYLANDTSKSGDLYVLQGYVFSCPIVVDTNLS